MNVLVLGAWAGAGAVIEKNEANSNPPMAQLEQSTSSLRAISP